MVETELGLRPEQHQPDGADPRADAHGHDPSEHARVGVAGAILAVAAAVAVLTNSPGWYVADARFEQYWAPGQFLARHQWMWDGVRGLGRPAQFFSPVIGSFLFLLHELGASPALSERALHGTYLLIAGLGMVQVMRLFRPHVGPEHVLAALVFMFSPYTTQFLLPSGLFLHYALSPWLLSAFVLGVRGPDRWRWAAVFALAVFAVGGLNTSALAYAALPLLPALLYLAIVERSLHWRAVASWASRAALLTLLISAATLVYVRSNIAAGAENLATSELPTTVNRFSSWSETWRGLGNWLTYIRISTVPFRPEAGGYFSETWVIVATYIVPFVALAALWRSRWRPRLFFAAIAVLSLIVMVGLYPVDHLTPAGRLLRTAYDHSLLLQSFRNTYKAGSGLGIGIAGLSGIAIADATRWLGVASFRWIRPVCFGLAALVIGVASFPFWTGQLYSRADRVKQVPEYWHAALDWLDARPEDGRVLVLPGSTRTRYRWGYVGDDIFDALLARPHLVRQSLSQGTAEAANLLVALDDAALSHSYTAGSIGPIARRLGVRWVLIRNDIAWETSNWPRPSALAGVRADPGLQRVASFGRRGENVTNPLDGRARALGEAELPPVEVYRVRDDRSPVQLRASLPPLLVSGDGDAWPRLANDGTLNTVGPVRYTAALSGAELRSLVPQHAPIVITDTNRRRVTQVTTSRNVISHTLAAGERLQREPRDLFHRAGSESVATFPDARRITASRYGSPSTPYQTWLRPSNAFDGDPDTAWLVGGLRATGEWVRVDFKRPVRLDHVDISRAATGARRVTRATLRFSNGTEVPAAFHGTTETKRFPARTTRSLEVRIDAVGGVGLDPVGFSDISVPTLDLAETIALPTDLALAAAHDRQFARELASTPVTFSFERLTGAGQSDAEIVLRRRFETNGSRTYELNGTLKLSAATPARVVESIRAGALDAGACADNLFRVDGTPVPVRMEEPGDGLLRGATVRFQGCVPVHLVAGTHRLDSQPGVAGLVDRVELATGSSAGPAPNQRRGTVRVLSETPTSLRVRVDAPDGGYLITGQSFTTDWHASANGHDLGSPQALDTLTGWRLPGPGVFDVVVSYRPQRLWNAALAVTGGTAALCLWLVLRRPRDRAAKNNA